MSNPNKPFDLVTPRTDGVKKNQPRGKKAINIPKRSPEDIKLARQLLDKVQQMPDVRQDLCEEVKRQIEQGTYETPERLEKAVNRLLEELFDEEQQPPHHAGGMALP